MVIWSSPSLIADSQKQNYLKGEGAADWTGRQRMRLIRDSGRQTHGRSQAVPAVSCFSTRSTASRPLMPPAWLVAIRLQRRECEAMSDPDRSSRRLEDDW